MRHMRMVGILIVMTCFVLSATTAGGVPLKPSVTVKGGMNFGSLSADDFDVSSRSGLAAGLAIKVPMIITGLAGEFLYSQKGFKDGDSVLGSFQAAETRYDYLEVPLLMRLDFPSPVVSAGVYAGPAVSILMKAEHKVAGSDEWVDIKDDLSGTDFSLVVGATAGIGKLSAEVRYTHGLRDTGLKEVVDETNFDSASKNRTFSVLIGYTIF